MKKLITAIGIIALIAQVIDATQTHLKCEYNKGLGDGMEETWKWINENYDLTPKA